VVEKAKTQAIKMGKSALAIDCYRSETDNEIGRSDEHAKHMRKTRRKNFARKMKLIDPHYGKKAAAVLTAGTIAGLAAVNVPAVGPVLGPSLGGAVIAGGLAYIETDAHRKVGDHAILDSLLDDSGDNWRTNVSMVGFDGHGDRISEFDRQQMLCWSDSEDDDLDDLLPAGLGGTPGAYDDDDDESDPSCNPLFDSLSDKPAPKAAPRGPASDLFQLLDDEPSSPPPATTTPTAPAPKAPVDDFFALMMQDTPPQSTSAQSFQSMPSVPTANPVAPQEFDFFADFGGSKTANPVAQVPPPSQPTQPQQPVSFFSAMASAIPSSSTPNATSPPRQTLNQTARAQAPSVSADPFADLYARATSS